MADKAINFKFGGNSDELEKMLKRVQNGFSSLEKMGHMVAGAFAFEKIRSGFMAFVTEADEADVAGQKLRATFAGAGTAGDPAAIIEMAEALEQLTTYEADVTVEAASMMARFKLTQGQIEQMLPAVQDFAAYLGKDLVSASDAVGKAVQVGSQGLRSLDLGFNAAQRAAFDLADAQGRVEMITHRINTSMKGHAQMMANTATGAAKQYGNALKNLEQSLGAVLQRPVAAVFHMMADATRRVTVAFDTLSPTARGVIAVIGMSAAALAAGVAGFVALASAAGMLTPIIGPIIMGFATLMASQVSLAGTTGVLRAAFVSVRTAAVTAWGGILAPLLAVGAAIVGVIAFLGAMARNWDDVKFNARTAMFAIRDWWDGMTVDLATMWGGFVDGIIEKFVLIKSMLSGMSPEAAGEAARAAVASSGGAALLAKIKTAAAEAGAALASKVSDVASSLGLEGAGDALVKDLRNAGTDLRKDLGAGVDVLVAGAKKFGIDFAGIGAEKKAPEKSKGGGGGGGDDEPPASLKEMFSGMGDSELKKAEVRVAKDMIEVFGSGSSGMAAASRYMSHVQSMSGLSESTLTTIMTRAGTHITGVASVGAALRGISDATVQALLKASSYNMETILGVAPALQGVSDATVGALLKAAGGSLAAVASVAPHVRTMSDDAVKKFLDLKGSLAGLSRMGDDFNAQGPVMASATASTNAYWETFGGKMDLLKAKASEAGMGMVGNMGAVGGAFSGVMTALGKGDIMGAVIGGIASVVTQSKSFQAITKMLNDMFTDFAQALNPLFDGLGPILTMVGTLLGAVADAIASIFEGIQPLFALITTILQPVFLVVTQVFGALRPIFQAVFAPLMPIVKGLMPIFKMVTDLFAAITPILIQLFMKTSPLMLVLNLVTALFEALAPLFKLVSQVIAEFINLALGIFKGLAGVWNSIINFIADLAFNFINLFPGMEAEAKKFSDGIRGAAINIGELDAAMKQVTATSTSQSDVTMPDLAASMDEAGDSAEKTGEEMGNLPQGFKIQLAQFTAATAVGTEGLASFLSMTKVGKADSAVPVVVAGSLPSVASTAQPGATGGGGGGLGGAGPSVNIYVNNPDPAALAATVKAQLDALALQKTGNPNGGGGFATPATGSSYK